MAKEQGVQLAAGLLGDGFVQILGDGQNGFKLQVFKASGDKATIDDIALPDLRRMYGMIREAIKLSKELDKRAFRKVLFPE